MASIFSRIITGELPGEFVFQDPLWVAFLDLKPTAFGHTLLVPRQEAQHLQDLSVETLTALGPTCSRLIGAVKAACQAPAVNVVLNDGPAAGQVVYHAHLHLIPRFVGDGRPPFSVRLDYPAGMMGVWGSRLRAAWKG